MRKHLLIITSILLLVVYFSTGCKKDDENQTNEFLIQVDSLKMADTVDFGSILDVDFYGLIGTNDCYKFSKFQQVESIASDPENSLRVQTFGKIEDNGNCQAGLVYMNPVTLQISGMLKGNFRLLALQPDGTVMTAVCYVRE